jgi:hypothetical protein
MIIYASSILFNSDDNEIAHAPHLSYRYEEYSVLQKVDVFQYLEKFVNDNPRYIPGNCTISVLVTDVDTGTYSYHDLRF